MQRPTTTTTFSDPSGRVVWQHLAIAKDSETATRFADQLQRDGIPAVAFPGDDASDVDPSVVWWTYADAAHAGEEQVRQLDRARKAGCRYSTAIEDR